MLAWTRICSGSTSCSYFCSEEPPLSFWLVDDPSDSAIPLLDSNFLSTLTRKQQHYCQSAPTLMLMLTQAPVFKLSYKVDRVQMFVVQLWSPKTHPDTWTHHRCVRRRRRSSSFLTVRRSVSTLFKPNARAPRTGRNPLKCLLHCSTGLFALLLYCLCFCSVHSQEPENNGGMSNSHCVFDYECLMLPSWRLHLTLSVFLQSVLQRKKKMWF